MRLLTLEIQSAPRGLKIGKSFDKNKHLKRPQGMVDRPFSMTVWIVSGSWKEAQKGVGDPKKSEGGKGGTYHICLELF